MILIYRYKGKNTEKGINAYKSFLNLLKENNHELVSEYLNTRTKVSIDFNCGHEYHEITPSHYREGKRCPRCSNKSSKQAYENLTKLMQKNNHELLSEYINSTTKVLIDFKCGHDAHWITPNDYKNGYGCPKCAKNCKEQARNEFYSLINKNGHRVLTEYKDTNEKVLIDFKCGHEPHSISPKCYKKGVKCPKCSNSSIEQSHKKLLAMLKENGHEIQSEYINNITKVLIDFKCGHNPHWLRPHDYKKGARCPRCSESKGEKIIQKYLEDNKIEYKSQYRIITDNKDMSKKKYDIYIEEYNLIVEIHGRQHYEEVDFFSDRTLKEEKENDKNKKEYAIKNNYRYMVVNYREHDPELTLNRFIKQFKELEGNTNE